MKTNLAGRLRQTQSAKHWRGPGCAAKAEKLLRSLQIEEFRDGQSLISVHDALLFLRAFPQSSGVAREAERLLAGVEAAIGGLRDSGADLSCFDCESVSGMAGTTLRDSFTYEVARWLARRYPRQARAHWNVEEQARRLGAALPRFLLLLDDDALVEADTPYLSWLGNAAGKGQEWQWLLRRLEAAPIPLPQKTELYDALEIQVEWDLSASPASRTRARRARPNLFVHEAPLIRRNQVSLEQEFRSAPPAVRTLSFQEGAEILDMCRDAVTVRYRELYGTTRGDPSQVYEADAGRGVRIYLWGLPPERRLPLRAYHAGFTLKNGVPVNYIEGISLFEWMEVGFNTFYAYREGETAWIYSKALRFLHHLTGATCISVYPYQLGHENEEAIESGAFWFYRKLGFRPGRADLLALARKEEQKMARDPDHRSSAPTLRRLAAGHAFYEFAGQPPGRWDTFSTRNLGLAIQRKMAADYGGDPEAMRHHARAALAQIVKVDPESWTPMEQVAFENFAVLSSLLPEMREWGSSQRQSLADIIRSKAAAREIDYLHLLQRHDILRDALVRLGSAPAAASADPVRL